MPLALRDFFSRHELDPKQPVLLALSGGVDSVVLSHLLREEGFSFALAHCNFGLRGAESDEDENFCRQWAERLGVQIHVQHFDTANYASANGISIQMAARDMRYAWFDELRIQNTYAWVLTAHHANDQAETVLLNLTRGTGLKGLGGIYPVNGHLLRPLLEWNRSEILRYAKAYKLAWREDSSNSKTDYLRNGVRHEIIPYLEKINPAFIHGIEKFTVLMQAHQHYFQEEYEKWKTNSIVWKEEEATINKSLFFASPELFLHEWLQEYGFPHGLAAEIKSQQHFESGKLFHSATYTLLADREVFIMRMRTAIPKALLLKEIENSFAWEGKNYRVSTINKNELKDFSAYPSALLFDKGKLQFPLQIRSWQHGDRFTPLGMQGSKLLSDFFTDKKLNVFEKDRVGIMVSGDRIVAVLGYRIDDFFRVTEDTREVWMIE